MVKKQQKNFKLVWKKNLLPLWLKMKQTFTESGKDVWFWTADVSVTGIKLWSEADMVAAGLLLSAHWCKL